MSMKQWTHCLLSSEVMRPNQECLPALKEPVKCHKTQPAVMAYRKKEVIHAPSVPYIPRASKTWHKPDGGQSTFKQDQFISSTSLKWPLNYFKRVTINILDIRHHTLQFTAALVISIVENACKNIPQNTTHYIKCFCLAAIQRHLKNVLT